MPDNNKSPVIQIRLKCSDGTLLFSPGEQQSRGTVIEAQIQQKPGELGEGGGGGGSVDVGVSGRVMREILKYCQLSAQDGEDRECELVSGESFVCSSTSKGGMFVLKASSKSGSERKNNRKESERVQQRFIQGLKMDELKQFVKAAHLLKMEDLTNRLCAEIAERITDKSVDEIRESFVIENDWAEDEDERIRQIMEAYDCKNGDESGLNGFHHVALQGLDQMVPIKKLLDVLKSRGDNINARENKDLSPLDIAVMMGHDELAEQFVFLGAIINARDSVGKIALHKAAQNGKVKCIEVLIRMGAEVDAQDNNGWCPIHFAAQSGSLECMVELTKAGCNFRIRASNEIYNNSTPAQMYCFREGQQLKLIEGRLERAHRTGYLLRKKNDSSVSQEKQTKENLDDKWDLDDIMKQFPDETKSAQQQKPKSQKKKKGKKKKAKQQQMNQQHSSSPKEVEVENDEVDEVESKEEVSVGESNSDQFYLSQMNNSIDDEYFDEVQDEQQEQQEGYFEEDNNCEEYDEFELQDQQRLEQIYNLLLSANNNNSDYMAKNCAQQGSEEDHIEGTNSLSQNQCDGQVIVDEQTQTCQRESAKKSDATGQFQETTKIQQQDNLSVEIPVASFSRSAILQDSKFFPSSRNQLFTEVDRSNNDEEEEDQTCHGVYSDQMTVEYSNNENQSYLPSITGEDYNPYLQDSLQSATQQIYGSAQMQKDKPILAQSLEEMQLQKAQEEQIQRQQPPSSTSQLSLNSKVFVPSGNYSPQVYYVQDNRARSSGTYYGGVLLPDEDEVVGAAFTQSQFEQDASPFIQDEQIPKSSTGDDIIDQLPSSLFPSPRETDTETLLGLSTNSPQLLAQYPTPPSQEEEPSLNYFQHATTPTFTSNSNSSPFTSPYEPHLSVNNQLLVSPLLSADSQLSYPSEQVTQDWSLSMEQVQFRSLPQNFSSNYVNSQYGGTYVGESALPFQCAESPLPLQSAEGESHRSLSTPGCLNLHTKGDVSILSPQTILQPHQQRILMIPESLLVCPLTNKMFEEPVVASDGYTYEKRAIEGWLQSSANSPVTNQELPNMDLVPNLAMMSLIQTGENLQL